MSKWYVKIFEPREIRAAHEWAKRSVHHIALHENPFAKKFAYHVIGTNRETLEEFGRMAKCYKSQFSVMDTHGTKTIGDTTFYHYDDWRKQVIDKYEQLIKKLETQEEE